MVKKHLDMTILVIMFVVILAVLGNGIVGARGNIQEFLPNVQQGDMLKLNEEEGPHYVLVEGFSDFGISLRVFTGIPSGTRTFVWWQLKRRNTIIVTDMDELYAGAIQLAGIR